MINFEAIKWHYEHAVEKHPFFAADICETDKYSDDVYKKEREHIKEARKLIGNDIKAQMLLADECLEIYDAYVECDLEHAEYEVYDAIAVLLRMADMINEKKEKGGKKL